MKNRYQELLDQVNTMTLEQVTAAEEEIKEEYEKMASFNKKELAKQVITKKSNKPKEETYKNITSVRYGVMNLYAELGINHDKEYSKSELIKILNENGYFEFNDKSTEFAQHSTDGTLVIIIKGSSKGMSSHFPYSKLKSIEEFFKAVYTMNNSEARALVYLEDYYKLDYLVKLPPQINNVTSTTSDIEFNIQENGKKYHLVMDLHSHHIMGAFFSKQDDANEMFRNIIFGVFSWKFYKGEWKFRIFDGKEFKYLNINEVME